MTQTERRLVELFKEVEAEFSNHSTAFVLEVTAERARVMKIKHDCDCSDIADALFEET